jgi:uncharacterized protein (TIGR02594 family)
MTDTPVQLATMRSLLGTQWSSGPMPDGMRAWGEAIIARYPEMSRYLRPKIDGGYFPWCGYTVAYCLTMAGIKPPFGSIDEKRFLWANSFSDGWGTRVSVPQQGDVLVFRFSPEDEHVTIYDGTTDDATHYDCLGGNQSHEVRHSEYRKDQCIAIVRPPGLAVQSSPSPQSFQQYPLIKKGDTGPAVAELQRLLMLPPTGT